MILKQISALCVTVYKLARKNEIMATDQAHIKLQKSVEKTPVDYLTEPIDKAKVSIYANQSVPAEKIPNNNTQTDSSNTFLSQLKSNTSHCTNNQTVLTSAAQADDASAALPPVSLALYGASSSTPTSPTASVAYKPETTPPKVSSPVEARPAALNPISSLNKDNGTVIRRSSEVIVKVWPTATPTERWNITVCTIVRSLRPPSRLNKLRQKQPLLLRIQKPSSLPPHQKPTVSPRPTLPVLYVLASLAKTED